jgi:hypothetical protein
MKQVKKPKPLGVCNICNALTDQSIFVNQRCGRTVNGKRCAGQFRNELSRVWGECDECRALGKVGSQICGSCSGFGWMLIA